MNIPTHVAIILDGNRRWAKEKRLPTFEGHRRGFEKTVEIGKKARELGIKILTFWGFSTENWDRSKEEVNYLMNLYETWIDRNLKVAIKEQICIIHLGRKDRFRESLRKKIIVAEEKTKKFSKYYLCIALDYGGRDEVLRVAQQISSFVKTTEDKQNLTEKIFESFLDTKNLPQQNVDLIIRTGGEQRMSGFMMWQGAYAEYIFVDKYLPNFTPDDFEKCINEYSKRQRRFGK